MPSLFCKNANMKWKVKSATYVCIYKLAKPFAKLMKIYELFKNVLNPNVFFWKAIRGKLEPRYKGA